MKISSITRTLLTLTLSSTSVVAQPAPPSSTDLETLRARVQQTPKDAQAQFELAQLLIRNGQGREGWPHLRQAVILQPKHQEAAGEFLRIFNHFKGKGLFNIGTPAEAVREWLGEPDRAMGSEERPQWIYGFVCVNFHGGQVYSVLDLRDLPPTGANPLARLNLKLDGERWREGYRYIDKSQASTEYVRHGETPQNWTELFSSQRLIHAATKLRAHDVMKNIHAHLSRTDEKVQFRVLLDEGHDVVFEWKLSEGHALGPQHELVRLVQGERDVHRLAFTKKATALGQDQRDHWLASLRGARLETSAKKDDPAQKLTQKSREIVAEQIRLIGAGDAEGLKEFFVPSIRDRIDQDLLMAVRKRSKAPRPEDLVHEVRLQTTDQGPRAVIFRRDGKVLTHLVVIDGAWMAESIWFE